MIESNRSFAAAETAPAVDTMLRFERLLTDVSSRFIDWPVEPH